MFATGGCLCGAIRFEVAAPPVRTAQCHCEDCRRLTGTGHIVQAFFDSAAVTITGQTAIYENVADSGNARLRHFCPTCGATLFSQRAGRLDSIGIAVGSFDKSDWFEPQVTVYTAQRPAWDRVDPDIPSFPGSRQ